MQSIAFKKYLNKILLKMGSEWKFATWHICLTLLSSHFYIANSSHYLEILRLGAFILHFCAVIFTLQILHN